MSYKSTVGNDSAFRQEGMGNRYFNERKILTDKDVKPSFNMVTRRRQCHWCKASAPMKGGKVIDGMFFKCVTCVMRPKKAAAA